MTMFELKDLPSFETLSKFAKEYHNPDLEGVQTWLQVAKATSDMMLAFEANLARHGLSQTKFFVLLLLKRNPSGLGLGKLAEGVSVSSPTMTGIIDRMERSDLCRREQDANDRRAWIVRLLPEGETLLAQVLPDHYLWVARLMSDFNTADRLQLCELMARLTQALSHAESAREAAALSN
ncbi:MarR family winged helix-turn-helix transcriptional regulator [Chromobacterium subtsugae]|uniref:MarR family winged helix-turn-helix transcriptional regulator n=2 Tax=Chromobacterium subtsugae TaxID=251747 RepID=UPI000B33DEDE|nr:MarR family transcriptional regulator [Chromobacterium subtsugae]